MKIHLLMYSILFTLGGWMGSAGSLGAATYYWDTNGTTAGSDAATGTWDSGITADFTTDSTGVAAPIAVTTTSGDTLTFSAGSNGTTGIVTVAAGGEAVGALTLTQPGLTFNGGAITLSTATTNLFVGASATFNDAITTTGIQFTAAGQTLSLAGGSGALLNGNATATTGNATTSTLSLTNGTYALAGSGTDILIGDTTGSGANGLQIGTGATVNFAGSFYTGNGGTGLTVINAGGAAVDTVTTGGYLIAGRGGTSTARIIVNGGTVDMSRLTSNAAAGVLVGFQGATGTIDVNAGSLMTVGSYIAVGAGQTAAGQTATFNLNGGTVNTAALYFGSGINGNGGGTVSTAGTNVFNLNGGSLYIGLGGIAALGTTSNTINLAGGALGASAAWSSSLNMSLNNTGGTFSIQAADANTNAFNIALSGNLTGAGGFTKTGGGNLTLSGTNAYSGATAVNAGTLLLGSTGALGSAGTFSAVTLNGGTVGFVGSLTVANTRALTLAASSFLDFGGGVDSLTFADSSSTAWTNGAILKIFNWTAGSDILSFTSNSGLTTAQLADIQFYSDNGLTLLGSAAFTGTNGDLMAAVPEPGTWALLGSGLGLLLIRCRRRLAS